MIPPTRIPLLLAIILAFTATGFAQKFCTVSPPSPFHHNGLIVTSFDQSAGRMKATLEHPNTIGSGVYLFASFFYQDRRVRTPPTVDIYFVSAAKHPKYSLSHNVSIYIDGNPLAYGQRTNYLTERGERGLTIEKTVITLSYADLVNLTNADRVTARVGETEVTL